MESALARIAAHSLLSLAALLGAALAPARARADVGVAFVHGTGRYTDARADYWTPGFVDTVRRGLPDPEDYLVVNCDFSRFMWDARAAGCLAEQLTAFIDTREITSLIVITHSNGANVVRWILSNPTYDSRYPRIIAAIARVDALAPASLGTPLAEAAIAGNLFQRSLGRLLDLRSQAVVMLQTSHMAYYNENWLHGTAGRPPLPVPMRAVIGTDVESSPLDRDSYCGGYALNLGLEATQLWLDPCSDGFLNCDSQAGAGEVWFYDTSETREGEPLSHAQSRHGCFGLDQILRDSLAPTGAP